MVEVKGIIRIEVIDNSKCIPLHPIFPDFIIASP